MPRHFTPLKKSPLCTEQEAGWASEPIKTFWRQLSGHPYCPELKPHLFTAHIHVPILRCLQKSTATNPVVSRPTVEPKSSNVPLNTVLTTTLVQPLNYKTFKHTTRKVIILPRKFQ